MLKTRRFKGSGVLSDTEAIEEALVGQAETEAAPPAEFYWVTETVQQRQRVARVRLEPATWEKDYLTAEDDPVLAELWDNADDAIYDDV
jgi:hypothetical protein